MLLLSEKSIEVTSFSLPKKPAVFMWEANYLQTWAGSYLRAWLNGPFYGLTYSNREKEVIQETNIVDSFTHEITSDKVFILDENESLKYYQLPQVDKKRTCYLERRNTDKYHLGYEICDWVRSWCVDINGEWGQGVCFGDRVYKREQEKPFYCVRPAVWVKAEG